MAVDFLIVGAGIGGAVLANLLSRLPGRMADAIDEYRQAIRIQPDFTEAQNNLGNALQSAGDLPAAIDAFLERAH